MKTHLVFAIMTIALLAFVISRSERRAFTFDTIVNQFTHEPYEKPKPLLQALRELSYDQVRDIRFKEDQTLWRKQGLPFQVRFFYTAGDLANHPITVFQINDQGAGQVRFSPSMFDFGPLVKLSDVEKAAGDFSGFRVYHPINTPGQLDEIVAFQGGSYFRPLAKGQQYGISARGIAIDTLGREDFPSFTTFWLVEPTPNASELKFYAALQGRDITGAYEFIVQPGPETRIRVHAVLFPRVDIRDLGLAPLTSMFWYGENTSNTFGNWRPEVHDSDGLQIRRANDEWVWRPLAWAKQRQVNTYADRNPRGFGLFQRDRDFTHYQDLEANYHLRPSIWVQPEGDWGEGEVVLMQNPTKDEYADNIVAYWRPKGGAKAGQRLELTYTLTTFTRNDALPWIGRCISTRIDYQNEEYYRQIFLDFEGGELDKLPAEAPVQPDIWVNEVGAVSKIERQKIPNTDTWRVSFTVSTKQTSQPIEMTCRLKLDGRPITETWSYTWVK